MMFAVRVDGWSPSWNDAYRIARITPRGSKTYSTLMKTKDAEAWQTKVMAAVMEAVGSLEFARDFRRKPEMLIMTLLIEGPWLTKDGMPIVHDASNALKLTEDALAMALGYDDKWHFAVMVEKLIAPRKVTRIVVESHEPRVVT